MRSCVTEARPHGFSWWSRYSNSGQLDTRNHNLNHKLTIVRPLLSTKLKLHYNVCPYMFTCKSIHVKSNPLIQDNYILHIPQLAKKEHYNPVPKCVMKMINYSSWFYQKILKAIYSFQIKMA